MNGASIKRNSGLWALDAALLLFGLIVLLVVFRLLRFDDPNLISNAWIYVMGVPTVLVATSMLTRVLANDLIEKSIQLGLLLSVGLHLFLVFFATKVVLFDSDRIVSTREEVVQAASNQPKTLQFFQPANSSNESRPDYLRPVQTEQNVAQPNLDPVPRLDESATLDIEAAKDEIQPKLVDKLFDKPRREASPSQPTISSTAERLDRPDLSKTLDPPKDIELPNFQLSSSMPSQEVQPSQADVDRVELPSRDSHPLAELPQTKLNIESYASQGPQQLNLRNNFLRDERVTDRDLEKAINRTASDLPEPPRTLELSTRAPSEFDKPMAANVPLPQLETPAITNASDRPSERDTAMRVRSTKDRVSRQSVEMTTLQGESNLEPSLKQMSASNANGKPKTDATTLLSDRSFLTDPRLAMNDAGSGPRQPREIGESSSAPAAGQPVPTLGGVETSGEVEAAADLSEAIARGDISKAEIVTRRSSNNSLAARGNQEMSLSPNLRAPLIDVNREAWTGFLLDSPRKGMDPVKREIVLPEIRDADISIDRLRRPETGGPKIANSAVPIPVPAFSQRLKRNRDEEDSAVVLGQLGPQTEEAIERGLQFLAKHQRDDGSWHLEDFGERVDIRSETAATALSLLSFQGAGYTHRQFKFEGVCSKALKWMIDNQRPNGDLYLRTDPKSDGNAWLYSHAIATLALCEAYGMTQDDSIKQNAQRAIDFLVESQDPDGGGWRYQPRIGSDTSVTGWCMMALKSAELSGLDVSTESYRGIAKWLRGAQASEKQKYLYRYNWQAVDAPATRHGRVPTPVMTSVGLLMQLYLGWRRDNPDMQRGTEWLLERLPAEGTSQNPQRDTYYWYYATQVMFHMGGERWKAWHGSLYPMLIRTQKRDGQYVGSWEPNGRIPDAWGRFGGRLYVTTLNLLSLEVYYRHLPIYEATAD